MKRFLLALALLVLPLLGTINVNAAERSQTLKVYNWADYINQDVLNSFPAWYKEQTGEDVEIIYQTFDINESMCTQIEVGHEDYDVICPSDYMIERMLNAGLLQKIDRNYGNTPDYTSLISPFIDEQIQKMSPYTSVNVLDFTVGYMWGTTGILYNTNLVDKNDIVSLGGLLNPKFEGKVFVKDAFRDVYSIVVLYVYRDEIARGEVTRDELIANVTKERIERVEKYLMDLKKNTAGWEVDFGKEEMTKGKAWLNLSWSGDAMWSIEQARENNVSLDYVIPQEGSNIWLDGWCIPKYAVNTKAASYFINYMCMPENAIKNMEEIGYVSVISSPEILEWAQDTTFAAIDISYFFGENADSVCVNPIMYPDSEIIAKCALMHDAGDMTQELINMWNRVKGDNLNMGLVWFLAIIVLGGIVFAVYVVINKRQLKEKQTKKKSKHKK
jgi:spermidine/putrescine transport system substrate-binding protein